MAFNTFSYPSVIIRGIPDLPKCLNWIDDAVIRLAKDLLSTSRYELDSQGDVSVRVCVVNHATSMFLPPVIF
jgi:hypothetical protein